MAKVIEFPGRKGRDALPNNDPATLGGLALAGGDDFEAAFERLDAARDWTSVVWTVGVGVSVTIGTSTVIVANCVDVSVSARVKRASTAVEQVVLNPRAV